MTRTAAQMVSDATALIDNVTPQDAASELTAGTAVLLDVREPVEWEQYIEGAVQVPRGLLEFQADPTSPRHNAALDPDRRVIVFCRSGVRATLAGATLKELGFADVANMTGGITAWKDAGLPTADHHEGM
jgi:rhodanese-related sulfurtransferase